MTFSAGRQPQEVCAPKWAPESCSPFPSLRLVYFPLSLTILSRPIEMLIVFNYNCCHTKSDIRGSSSVLSTCSQLCVSIPPWCWIWHLCNLGGWIDLPCVHMAIESDVSKWQEWRLGKTAYLRTLVGWWDGLTQASSQAKVSWTGTSTFLWGNLFLSARRGRRLVCLKYYFESHLWTLAVFSTSN